MGFLMRLNKVNILLCLTGLFLAGCASNEVNLSDSPYSQAAAIKGQGGSYKVGKPYKISGQWYYPKIVSAHESGGAEGKRGERLSHE